MLFLLGLEVERRRVESDVAEARYRGRDGERALVLVLAFAAIDVVARKREEVGDDDTGRGLELEDVAEVPLDRLTPIERSWPTVRKVGDAHLLIVRQLVVVPHDE